MTTRRPDLPPQIDYIVAKAMAKQPTDRYATCRELALALRALAADPAASGDSRGRLARKTHRPASATGAVPCRYDQHLHSADPCAGSGTCGQFIVAEAAMVVVRRWGVDLALIAGSTVGVMKYFSSRFPNAAERELLGQVPLALTMKNNSCNRNDEAEQDTANVEASVICTSEGDGANTVVFTKFSLPKGPRQPLPIDCGGRRNRSKLRRLSQCRPSRRRVHQRVGPDEWANYVLSAAWFVVRYVD